MIDDSPQRMMAILITLQKRIKLLAPEAICPQRLMVVLEDTVKTIERLTIEDKKTSVTLPKARIKANNFRDK